MIVVVQERASLDRSLDSLVIPDFSELKTKMISAIKEHLSEHENEHV